VGRVPDNSTDAVTTPPTADPEVPAGAEGATSGADTGEIGTDATDTRDESGTDAAASGARRRTGRRDWRLGGRTVAKWRERTLGVAIVSLGAAILIGTAITVFVPAAWAGLAATIVLWAGFLAGIVWAFSRSRPIGLLRLAPADVIFGLALGILLRFVQGWLEIGAGGSGALPSYPTIGGQLGTEFLFTEVVSPVVIAPVLEELFFRAVILVCLYTLLRRPFGKLTAGIAAAIGSSALFVLVHALTASLTIDELISLGLLGIVCSVLVLLTGRVWGAVLTHIVYNGTFVLLALAGTVWG